MPKTPPDPADLAEQIAELRRQVHDLSAGAGLRNASMREGTITIADANGLPKVRVGVQPDGRMATIVILDDTGAIRAEFGELTDGTYGLAVLDSTGTMVSIGRTVLETAFDEVDATFNTTSTTYVTDPGVGPEVTVEIGPSGRALVWVQATIGLNDPNITARVGVDVDGGPPFFAGWLSSSSTSGDVLAASSAGGYRFIDGLTPGMHTFTVLYRVTSGDANFSQRRLFVQPL